jgi:S-adenosylhomocysteine hydrolase
MQRLRMPLVDLLIDTYVGLDFSRVRIIGVQHILETTHGMFQALYQLGLKPENISVLGKCYSTCKEVYEEMIEDGIDVSEGSFSYYPNRSYDEVFAEEVHKFLSIRIHNLIQSDFDCIIVLDDGGKCIEFLRKEMLSSSTPIIAIEQTSSGYEAIRSHFLPFPVINVARSPLKLKLESPMIAEAAAERLYAKLHEKKICVEEALVIGGGAIGQAIQKRLSKDMKIMIYDRDDALSDYQSENLQDLIKHFPLILGCTGKTSVPYTWHSSIQPGTILVSVSSSDREFDAHYLRKNSVEAHSCRDDLLVNGFLLVNSGFPVNFDGCRENIEVELIQLTIALITGGILQAFQFLSKLPSGIISLDKKIEDQIESEFLQFVNSR